jgi:hypothetical protein
MNTNLVQANRVGADVGWELLRALAGAEQAAEKLHL